MINFGKYDNPNQASKVWRSYEEELRDAGKQKFIRALEIAEECISADSLDARLDLLFGKILHFAGNDAPSLNDIDEDCNGGYSNARRALEEG